MFAVTGCPQGQSEVYVAIEQTELRATGNPLTFQATVRLLLELLIVNFVTVASRVPERVLKQRLTDNRHTSTVPKCRLQYRHPKLSSAHRRARAHRHSAARFCTGQHVFGEGFAQYKHTFY